MAHFKLGLDLWECDCGSIVAMGKVCWQCGRNYADILAAKAKTEQPEQSDQPKKRKSKYRTPAKISGFLTSYCFKKEKN